MTPFDAHSPMRRMSRRRWLLAWLPLLLICGCGLPTWSELIGAKKEETQPLVVPVVPVQPQRTTPEPPPPPPPPNPAEIIAAFQSKPSYELDDAALSSLVNLPSGLEDVKVLNLNGSQITNVGIKNLSKLTHLTKLDIRNTAMDEAAANAIGQATSIEELRVDGAEFSDQGLLALRPLKNLRVLEFNRVRLSPAGWNEMLNHPELEELWIQSSNVSDEAMLILSRCKKLRVLHLNDVAITDLGLAQLSRVDGLEFLNCSGCGISGLAFRGVGGGSNGFMSLQTLIMQRCPLNKQGAALISQMKQLRVLAVGEMPTMQDINLVQMVKPLKELEQLHLQSDSGLSGNALVAVKDNESIETINLSGCSGIDDNGLRHLVKCKNLKKLILSGTRCSFRGATALKAELPDVEIEGIDYGPQ